MPKIPTYDNFQDVAQESPNARFDRLSDSISPTAESVGATEMQRMGQAVQQTGQDIGSDAVDAQNMANQVRVNDAMNQAREAAMALQYDPQNGFLQQKGAQAFNRDSGKPLADDYTDQLNQHINDISAGLGNDVQRQMFMENAGQLTNQFYGAAMQHEAQEFHNYSVSVQDGTIAVSRDAIGKNWNNPDVVQQNNNAIYAAAYQKALLTGHSATEAQALAQREASNGHVIAVMTAIQNNNIDYAKQYLAKYGSNMDADDVLRVSGILTKEDDNRTAMSTAGQVWAEGMANLNPSPAKQFSNVLMNNGKPDQTQAETFVQNIMLKGEETGGKDYDANGNVITSPTGAQGRMQVQPATAANPGFGVKPAQDNSLEEKARVGHDYAIAMLTKYGGNQSQAAAAYDAGPGAVDAAIKQAQTDGKPNDWLNYLPKETQAYVGRVVPAMADIATPQAKLPNLADMEQAVRERLGPNARPEVVRAAVTQIQTMYQAQKQQQSQQDDQAVANAIGALSRVRGDLSQLPPGTLEAVPPEKLTTVINAAKSFSQGVNVTNNQAYFKLSNPDYLSGLTDAQFLAYQPELSQADFKHFSDERQKLLNGSLRDTAMDLDRRGLNSIISDRLGQMGISMNATSKDQASNQQYVAAVTKYIHDSVLDYQQNTGKKMQYGEMSKYVDQLFARKLWFSNTTWTGGHGPAYPQNMLTMHPGDIPADSRAAIYNQLHQQGILSPTDAQILDAYWKSKGKQ